MRNASAFLFDRKFHFLSNKKDVDAHSRNVDVAWRNRARRECAPRRTLFYIMKEGIQEWKLWMAY